MGICYIVGAGDTWDLDFCLRKEDMVIAADGGYRKLQDVGIKPDLVVGDFDSLGCIPCGENVIRLPVVKDVTDTWEAVQQGMKHGYGKFHLYGCTGGRIEHTIANLQLLAYVTEQKMECRLYDRTQVIAGLCGGVMKFGPEQAGFCSLFSYTEMCSGVSIRGMKYELEDAELSNRFPLGVSNEFVGMPSTLSVEKGLALVVFDHRAVR